MYTSPHIACFRERILVNEQMISELDIEQLLTLLFAITEKENIPVTFFELTTLLAFKYFADNQVDIAVIETGLGGRLDATNILKPKLSVITSISLDHTELLGKTIEAITVEKAGIIKNRTPVVIGPSVYFSIIKSIADEQQSCIHQVLGDFETYDLENKAIAEAALQLLNIPQQAIAQGIEAVPRCRFEIFSHERLKTLLKNNVAPQALVMDVAHNPEGFKRLLKQLQTKFPKKPLFFVLGLSKSKDISACLNLLKGSAENFYLVEAANGRAAPVALLKRELQVLGVEDSVVFTEDSIKSSVAFALAEAARKRGVVAVCGTFFIMAEARSALGLDEPHDVFDMN
jgi:dihydrofolate synthase/folylpolyglutamate synthase